MSKENHKSLIREGKPKVCVQCGGDLHRKSEHYCSVYCEQEHRTLKSEKSPPFLSKWKIRKRKEEKDPLINVRKKTRRKSKELLKVGKIMKKPCVVCGSIEAIMHHEDYSNPSEVIWLCNIHHTEYHDGKRGLFDGKLWWNPARLIPKQYKEKGNTKKYAELKRNFKCNKCNKCKETKT